MGEAGPIFRRALNELGRFSSTVEQQPLYFAVDLARRILAREIGLVAGCREMVVICNLGNLHDCKALDAFVGVDSETDVLPIGRIRELWSADALVEADRKIEEADALYRDWIEDACRRLLAVTPSHSDR